MSFNTGLRLASFDGGGPRALSQVHIMETIMQTLKRQGYRDVRNKIMRPCDHFDLIGGSDIGGLIAIMFVKLKMTATEVSEKLHPIVDRVYHKDLKDEERTSILREWMESLLSDKNLPPDLKLQDEEGENVGCIGFVVVKRRYNMSGDVRLTTYPTDYPSTGITVIDAALATCALIPKFKQVSFGPMHNRHNYIGASFGASNPVRMVVDEAYSHFRDRREDGIAALLSLGSGHPGVLAVGEEEDSLHSLILAMIEDCEKEAVRMEKTISAGERSFYFRLSVQQGLQRNEIRAENIEWIPDQARDYVEQKDIKKQIDELVARLQGHTTADMLTLTKLDSATKRDPSILSVTTSPISGFLREQPELGGGAMGWNSHQVGDLIGHR